MDTKQQILQVLEEIFDEATNIDINFVFIKINELADKPLGKLSDQEILELLIEIQRDSIY